MKAFTERNPRIIGLIAIAVILVGTTGVLVFNSSLIARLRGNYTIKAVFPDTAGLRSGDEVTIAGVKVGAVGSIHQIGNAVEVALKVNHGVQVPDDSRASIRVETLLGRKGVRLETGSDWTHLLQGGAVIPETRTSSPTEVLDVQSDAQAALANLDAQSLNTFFADLAQVTAGKRDEVTTIINGLDRLSTTIDTRTTEVSQLIDATNAVTATLVSRDRQLVSLVDNLETVMAGLAKERSQIATLLATTQAAAGQLADLVGTNRVKLDAILAELHTDLAIVGQHQVDLAQGIAYLGAAIQGFQSIGYSGPTATPNTWANVFTIGLGPVSADPVFGCGGALDQALNAALGPDPDTCAQATGPIEVSPSAGVPGSAGAGGSPGAARKAAKRADLGNGPLLPVGSAASTSESLEALLVPVLGG